MRASEALGRTASLVERAIDAYEESCAKLGASTWTSSETSALDCVDTLILQDPVLTLLS